MAYGIDIKIQITGADALNRRLPAFRKDKLNDLRPLFRDKLLPLLRQYQEDVFKSEGAESEAKWEALNATYARWKARHFPGKGILERTGAMPQSFQGGGGAIESISKGQLRFGTSVKSSRGFPYPVAHQFGTRNMPKRPVLRPSRSMQNKIVVEIRNYLRFD